MRTLIIENQELVGLDIDKARDLCLRNNFEFQFFANPGEVLRDATLNRVRTIHTNGVITEAWFG